MAKNDGGLGIRYARLVNVALLGKLSWRVFNNEEAMWVSVLKSKYVSMSELSTRLKNTDSPIWKGIIRSFAKVQSFSNWRVRNGEKISLWFDNWKGEGPIAELI